MRPEPFFMLGAPRSGTSLLRNILRTHSRLDAPEETHFYRWSFPFKSVPYERQYRAPLLEKHRKLDGVPEDRFWEIWEAATSRRELQDRYMDLFLDSKGSPESGWFDKTPQNFFGALMIMADYPRSKLVHIHRDPIDVVASLVEGSVMKVRNAEEGIYHWLEPTRAIAEIERIAPGRVVSLAYHELVGEPTSTVHRLLKSLGLEDDVDLAEFQFFKRQGRNRGLLSENEIAMVRERCHNEMRMLGYS